MNQPFSCYQVTSNRFIQMTTLKRVIQIDPHGYFKYSVYEMIRAYVYFKLGMIFLLDDLFSSY